MNWYKKAQVNIVENPERAEDIMYTDIGHQIYRQDEFELAENILWCFIGRKFLTEIDRASVHEDIWPELDFDRHFSGRYESETKRISIHIPYGSPVRFSKRIPNFILSTLQRAFPEAENYYLFI